MTEPASPVAVSRSNNWPLRLGGILVALVLFLALFGPLLAPSNPLQEVPVLQDRTGEFMRPPFAPGQVAGYPLGSDTFGRDLLSRLLWAVRPTLVLVSVVAALRLLIGLWVGLLAGWSERRLGAWLEVLISAALSAPVLFVALCVIAAVGNDWGVWAFILGLALTGWADAARIVQSHTRAIRAQPFLEASRAMGASQGQLLLSHVLPHVLPLMWIQLAFEVSSTLLTTAGLGFLGYYINAIWVPLGDFTGLRASGYPELGQMLGTSSIQQQPWIALFSGSLVVLVVLAFNLLGEGLRRRLNPEERSREESERPVLRAGAWLGERVYTAVSRWKRTLTTTGIVLVLGLLLLGGGYFLYRSQTPALAATRVNVPGGALWAAEQRDPQGTSWINGLGPEQPAILWAYAAGKGVGLLGGPVVDKLGHLYITAGDRTLRALDDQGQLLWKVDLAGEPFGSPALAPDGTLRVLERKGRLLAYSSAGEYLWDFTDTGTREVIGSPVVSAEGVTYFATDDELIAVWPDGSFYWRVPLPIFSYTYPVPRISLDNKHLYFEDTASDAHTGALEYKPPIGGMEKFMIGADGKTYYRLADGMDEWQWGEQGAVRVQRARLDTRALSLGMRIPFDSGVSPSQNLWFLYYTDFDFPRLVWTDAQGQNAQVADMPYSAPRMIGIDAQACVYICGDQSAKPTECRSVDLRSGTIAWRLDLPAGSRGTTGGALIPGRLYVLTGSGTLFAIGDAK